MLNALHKKSVFKRISLELDWFSLGIIVILKAIRRIFLFFILTHGLLVDVTCPCVDHPWVHLILWVLLLTFHPPFQIDNERGLLWDFSSYGGCFAWTKLHILWTYTRSCTNVFFLDNFILFSEINTQGDQIFSYALQDVKNTAKNSTIMCVHWAHCSRNCFHNIYRSTPTVSNSILHLQ